MRGVRKTPVKPCQVVVREVRSIVKELGFPPWSLIVAPVAPLARSTVRTPVPAAVPSRLNQMAKEYWVRGDRLVVVPPEELNCWFRLKLVVPSPCSCRDEAPEKTRVDS